MDYQKYINKYQRKKILDAPLPPVSFDVEDIKKLIPHRGHFLFIEKITGLQLEQEMMTGVRFMDPKDPIFQDHFPEHPVYPAMLHLEMMGQQGLCLDYFLNIKQTTLEENSKPLSVRVTKILGAAFRSPIFPGQTIEIITHKIHNDGTFGVLLGQILVEGKIASVGVIEVAFIKA